MKKIILLLLGSFYLAFPSGNLQAQEDSSGIKVSYKSVQDITASEVVPLSDSETICAVLKITAKQTTCSGKGSIDCSPGVSILNTEHIGYTLCAN
ncbi:hypothetical protein [Sphingobacterium sp. 18053]|uniref:hypothetical protein n=1 Tax=Sphingobacterium sp. 18053 TaxID=2681401 RepID=UPI0013569052|nr:hypothetical protein [Sphingobacterium sp. 18053]